MTDFNLPGVVLAFGRFRVDSAQRLLWADDQVVPLEPKVFDTLHALVEARGRLLSKDELLARVWPDTFVEEGSLARNVSTLRKVLGENPETERFIATVPKRGYRFLAEVRALDPHQLAVVAAPREDNIPIEAVETSRSGPSAWPRVWTWASAVALTVGVAAAGFAVWGVASTRPKAASASASIRSIAVLPLRNLSGDTQDYFSDGVTEELITTLAQIQSLRVTSRTSVMRFKNSATPLRQIGQELGVDAVIEGSVQRDGDRVRVTAQLIDAKSDTHLWAHTYDGRLADVLNLQSELARTIAAQVEIRLTADEARRLSTPHTVKPAAYDELLMGQALRWRGGVDDLHTALEHYDRAAALDSHYAPAYVGMALTWASLSDPGAIASGRIAAVRAIELDPQLPEAHAALASVKYRDWDWAGGHAESELAIAANPGALDGCLCYAYSLAATGRVSEALTIADQAVGRNPLSGAAYVARGLALLFARRYEEAAAAFARGLVVDPNYLANTIMLAHTYELSGRAADAVAVIDRPPFQDSPALGLQVAVAYAHAGRRSEAQQILKKLTGPGSTQEAIAVASVYLALGDRATGLEWLRRSVEAREPRAHFVLDPSLDDVRSDPRFRALVARLNFPPEYLAFEASLPRSQPANATR